MQFGWPAKVNESSGQWTPDGSHFVFISDREGLNNVYELVTPRWFEFWKKPTAVRITGNQLTILGAAPARDSKSLFVLGRPDQGAMQALDLKTGKFVPYLDGLNAVNFVTPPTGSGWPTLNTPATPCGRAGWMAARGRSWHPPGPTCHSGHRTGKVWSIPIGIISI